MPEIDKNRYACYESVLGQQLKMAAGNLVFEYVGKVQIIQAKYNYIDTELWKKIRPILKSGADFQVVYLPDSGDELLPGTFMVTSMSDPSFSFSAGGKAYWTGLAFELREVEPHA